MSKAIKVKESDSWIVPQQITRLWMERRLKPGFTTKYDRFSVMLETSSGSEHLVAVFPTKKKADLEMKKLWAQIQESFVSA